MTAEEKIMEATIVEFNEKGMKFTMDGLAKRLGMSKKTIYRLFPDKQTLFLHTADYVFDRIKDSEREVYEDPSLNTLDKFKKILFVLPGRYKDIDFRRMSELEKLAPEVYAEVGRRLESGWDMTFTLFDKAVAEGTVKPISHVVLKAMVIGSVEAFLGSGRPLDGELTYYRGIDEMLEIMMYGMVKEEGN